MFYTLAEAAKAVGRTKPALLHAIKKGTLSARKTDLGTWEVDPSELFRVYKQAQSETENDNSDSTLLTAEKDGKIRELNARLEVMDQLVSELRGDKEKAEQREANLWRDVEHWKAMTNDAQQRLKALEAMKEPEIIEAGGAKVGAVPPPKKGFFRRFFGG